MPRALWPLLHDRPSIQVLLTNAQTGHSLRRGCCWPTQGLGERDPILTLFFLRVTAYWPEEPSR